MINSTQHLKKPSHLLNHRYENRDVVTWLTAAILFCHHKGNFWSKPVF